MEIELANIKLCTGCSVCADSCGQKAISILPDVKGFLYPQIDKNKCISCGACMDSCPIINQDIKENNFSQRIFYGLNKDISLTKKSSSGAIAPAFMQRIIENGGYVVGAAFDSEFNLEHSVCSSVKDLDSYIGSKYLQSKTENIFNKTCDLLKSGNQVIFLGTPCQIDALNLFLKGIDNTKLITCEILCHGVPSPKLFKLYINYLQKKYHSKVSSYNFRDKQWKWIKLGVRIKFDSKKQILHRARRNHFHSWFGAHLSLRDSCFNCKYRSLNRCADITLGDFWQYKIFDENFNSENGVSVVLVNSKKGELLVDTCSDYLNLNELDFSAYEKYLNTHKSTITSNFSLPPEREQFWVDFNSMDFIHFVKKWDVQSKYVIAKSFLEAKIKSIVK